MLKEPIEHSWTNTQSDLWQTTKVSIQSTQPGEIESLNFASYYFQTVEMGARCPFKMSPLPTKVTPVVTCTN